jgi:hypothetical protein
VSDNELLQQQLTDLSISVYDLIVKAADKTDCTALLLAVLSLPVVLGGCIGRNGLSDKDDIEQVLSDFNDRVRGWMDNFLKKNHNECHFCREMEAGERKLVLKEDKHD